MNNRPAGVSGTYSCRRASVRCCARTRRTRGAGGRRPGRPRTPRSHPPAAGARAAPVVVLPRRRRRREPPARSSGTAAAAGGRLGGLLVRLRRRLQGRVGPALAADDRGEPRQGPPGRVLLLRVAFLGVSPANAEDRSQEGPPPPRDLPSGHLLSGAHLRRAEEAQAGLVLARGVRARVGAPVRGGVGRGGARERPAGVVALTLARRDAVVGRLVVALGGDREEAVAEAGRADADGVGLRVELAPHRRARTTRTTAEKLPPHRKIRGADWLLGLSWVGFRFWRLEYSYSELCLRCGLQVFSARASAACPDVREEGCSATP
jgi:hypothetical protein